MLEYVLRTYESNTTFHDVEKTFETEEELEKAWKALDHDQSLIPKHYLQDSYWRMRYAQALVRPGHVFCPQCFRYTYGEEEEVSGY